MDQSINTLQAKQIYQQFIEKYLDSSLDSLANLGQRFGIKADDITYRDLSLENIFTEITDNKDDYVVKIRKNSSGQMFYNLINTKNIQNTYNDHLIFIDNIKIDSDLLIDTIYGIEEFHPESFMTINGEQGTMTCFLKGRYNQYNNDSLGCIIYLQYDINHNIIKHYINTSYFGTYVNEKHNENDEIETRNDYFLLQQLDLEEIGEKENKYKFNAYIFSLNDLAEEINNIYSDLSKETIYNLLFDLYRFDYMEDGQKKLGPEQFSPFNIKYIDYNELIAGNYEMDNLPFIKFVVNNPIYKYNRQNVELIYNKENDNYIYEFNPDDLKQLLGIYNNFTLNNYTYGLNKLQGVYHDLYYRYNNDVIYSETKIFYSYIFSALYDKLSNEIYNKLKTDIDYVNDALYIPLTYKIHVISGESLFNIYFSSPIYVSLTHDEEYYSTSKIIFYNKNTYNKTSSYVIEFIYNNEYKDILSYIYISKQYTLPYINSLNNWVINDEDTVNSSEYNELNGIKEILLHVKSLEENKDIKILNISDTSINQYFNKYETVEFTINPQYFNKYSSITNIICKTKVPVIDTSFNKNFFENTVLVILTDKDNIIGDYSEDYTLEYVYSLWKLDNNTNKFEYVSLDGKYAYDPYNDPKTYRNKEYKENISLLVPANNNLINTENVSGDNYYLNIRNKKAEYYNVKDYQNDYNTILEYVSNAKEDASNPIYENTKYINKLSPGEIQTINTLYPKNKVNLTIDREYTETEIKLILKSYNNINIYNSDDTLYYYSTNILNIEDVITVINTYFEQNTEESTVNITLEASDYYNEYLFNENIPQIDLKEIFVANNNVLNRTNILSLDNNGNIYNAYLGSSYDDVNKNTLYLSTSKININVGHDTLLNSTEIGNFNEFENLKINEFKNIDIDAKENITFNHNPLYNINNIKFGSVIPGGNVSYLPLQIYIGNNIEEGNTDLLFGVYYTPNNTTNESMFNTINLFYKINLVKKIQNNETEIIEDYIGINLNTLFRQAFGFEINNNYIFESDDASIMVLDVAKNTNAPTQYFYEPNGDFDKPVFFLITNHTDTLNKDSRTITNYILNHQINIAIKGNVIKVNFENDKYNQMTEHYSFTKEIINKYSELKYTFINTTGQITPIEN